MSNETDDIDSYLKEMEKERQQSGDMAAQDRFNESLPTTELSRVNKNLIDQVVDVYLKDGSICNGILFNLTETGATLKQARMIKKGYGHRNIGEEPVYTLLELPSSDLVKIVPQGVTLPLDGFVWNITPKGEEPVAPNVCSSNSVQNNNEPEENRARHPGLLTDEQEEKPPHSVVLKNEQEEELPAYSGVQKNEQEEQLPPHSGVQMNVVPYSASSLSSLGYQFLSSGRYQHQYQYRGQEQQGFPYNDQGLPTYPYSDQGQQGLLHRGQEQQDFPYTPFFGPQQQHPNEQFWTYNPDGSSPPVLPLPHATTTSFHRGLSLGCRNPHHLGCAPSGHAPMFPPGPPMFRGYFRPPGAHMFPGYLRPSGPPMFRGYFRPPGPPMFPGDFCSPGPRMFPGYFRPPGRPMFRRYFRPPGPRMFPGYIRAPGSPMFPGYFHPPGPPMFPGIFRPRGPSMFRGYFRPPGPPMFPGDFRPPGPDTSYQQ